MNILHSKMAQDAMHVCGLYVENWHYDTQLRRSPRMGSRRGSLSDEPDTAEQRHGIWQLPFLSRDLTVGRNCVLSPRAAIPTPSNPGVEDGLRKSGASNSAATTTASLTGGADLALYKPSLQLQALQPYPLRHLLLLPRCSDSNMSSVHWRSVGTTVGTAILTTAVAAAQIGLKTMWTVASASHPVAIAVAAAPAPAAASLVIAGLAALSAAALAVSLRGLQLTPLPKGSFQRVVHKLCTIARSLVYKGSFH